MKRLLTATMIAIGLSGMTAIAQHSGIDTTTTPSTDANVQATPRNLETGGRLLMEEGVEAPENYFEVEDAKKDSLIVMSEKDEDEEGEDGEDDSEATDSDRSPEINVDVETASDE